MKPQFAIGDVVLVKINYQTVAGEIVAVVGTDQACRILYRVDVPLKDDPTEESVHAYPEDALQGVPPLGAKEPFTASRVMDYFKGGGLIEILGCWSGGKTPARAHLRDQEGLVFTWVSDPEHLAGPTIPVWTLDRDKETNESKIDRAAKRRIVLYLRGFGLSRVQAEDVVAAFPTLP